MILPLIYGEYQGERFDRMKGQGDLVYREGKFYLYCTVEMPERPRSSRRTSSGSISASSTSRPTATATAYSGEAVERIRRRHHRNRNDSQRKGTKGAKKRLKKLAGREGRFRKHENHRISKAIVAPRPKAPIGASPSRTQAASATGSRFGPSNEPGTPVGLSSNSGRSWSTRPHWRASRSYAVDPRNTSRTCSVCGHCEKANRKSQADVPLPALRILRERRSQRSPQSPGLGRCKAASELAVNDPGWNPGEISRKATAL